MTRVEEGKAWIGAKIDTLFMTKMAAIWLKSIPDTQFMTQTAENHILWGRTYLYSPYKGVPPRVQIAAKSRKWSSKDELLLKFY